MPSAFGYNPNVPHQVPWIYISTSNNVHLWLYWSRVVLRIEKIDATVKRVANESLIKIQDEVMLLPSNTYDIEDWGEPTRTSVSWRQGCRHPTRNECMDWLAQINYWGSTRTSHISNHSNLLYTGWVIILKAWLLTSNEKSVYGLVCPPCYIVSPVLG